MNQKTKLISTCVFFLCLVIIGYTVFPFWAVVLSVWVVTILAAILSGKTQVLSSHENKLFWTVALGYPVLETLVKYLLVQETVLIPSILLNSFEHFLFSLCLSIIIYPFFKDIMSKLSSLSQYIFILGIVVIAGNFNEFAEYGIRIVFSLQSNFATYYPDTIRDLIINIAGGATGALILWVSSLSKSRATSILVNN